MPDRSPRAAWTALALGALEPGDAAALLRAAGPGAALRLATLRSLGGLEVEEPLPPLHAAAGRAPLLGDDDEITPTIELVRVGERFRLHVLPPAPAHGLRPLVLRESSSGLDRLLPVEGAPWPTLDQFMEQGGVRIIDLVAGPPAGLQSLFLGLLSAEEVQQPWPAGDPRDARIRDAVANRGLPGAMFTIQVI